MRCPICNKPHDILPGKGSPFPFCSDRCQTIDLGRWLDGKYQIPVEGDDETPASASNGPEDE